MTPQDLIKSTIETLSTQSNSDFVSVEQNGVERKTKIIYGDFSKKNEFAEDFIALQDEISFVNIITPEVFDSDTLIYENQTYKVAHYQKVGNGIFNISAVKI